MKEQLSIIDSIKQKYIEQNLESSSQINYTDLTEKDGLVKVFYDDLPNTVVNGYPIASDFVTQDGREINVEEFYALDEKQQKQCKLRYYYLPNYHELYVGTTGSGKTTGCVEPQLRAIAHQKNKPNLFLTDPKGELFDRNAQYLKQQGYELFVLNFKDLIRSDKWNPLYDLYDTHIQLQDVGKNVKSHKMPIKKNLKLGNNKKDFVNDEYYEYDGYAFANKATLDDYLLFQRCSIESSVDDQLNQLANMMITAESNTDKSWEYGAQDLLKGLLYCMLEDSVDKKTGFTKEMMTFKTIQEYYNAIKLPILDNDSGITLINHVLMANKTSKPRNLMSTALRNAQNTMRSYCGVFDGKMKDWFQGHILSLTTDNTIDLDNVGEQPFAIFLITRDYEKSDFLIAGLFIDWIYRKMLEKAESDKSSRAFHFLLDEFGNIPKIKDLENKIATARSRNIWFHLFVQSYKQIDIVYGSERSVVIRDNCNSQIFLGAQNRETKEIFSKECGQHFIPTLRSKIDPNDHSIQESPVVPVSRLDQIIPGQMYTKRLYMPVTTTQYIRSYICAKQGAFDNFINANGLETCTPTTMISFGHPKYKYKLLENVLKYF
ncbi:MAG: type IV secretory system conjugative DNA transfer family protein [Christensenellales bacterium]